MPEEHRNTPLAGHHESRGLPPQVPEGQLTPYPSRVVPAHRITGRVPDGPVFQQLGPFGDFLTAMPFWFRA